MHRSSHAQAHTHACFDPYCKFRYSERDLQILGMIARGDTFAEIANKMNLASSTIRNRLSHLYREMGVRSSTAAVVQAYRRGLLNLEDIPLD